MIDYNSSDDVASALSTDANGNLLLTLTKGSVSAPVLYLTPDGRLHLETHLPSGLGLQLGDYGTIVLA